jgi:hypothetical protein
MVFLFMHSLKQGKKEKLLIFSRAVQTYTVQCFKQSRMTLRLNWVKILY